VTDATSRQVAYGYDANSRLISETITADPRGATFNGALGYMLDSVGNRVTRTSTLASLGAQTFGYDANDQFTSDGYDANGNTTSSGSDAYAYDSQNRLVSKTGPAGTVTLVYDCNGNRVAKSAGGVTTQYLVDDLNPTGYLQVLEELQGRAVQARYTYGATLVSQTRNITSTPVVSYYGYDAHGNITFLTDAAGTVTDTYDYDAWGTVVASVGSTPNTRLYAGEELDSDLGLINLRARQYRPGTGRFLTIDPMQEKGTSQPIAFNRYLYGDVDPVNASDPTGRVTLLETTTFFRGLMFRAEWMLHGAHHPFTILGLKLYCVHLQLALGIPGILKAEQYRLPIYPFCRLTSPY
jgi:RHS repeat-associated protein